MNEPVLYFELLQHVLQVLYSSVQFGTLARCALLNMHMNVAASELLYRSVEYTRAAEPTTLDLRRDRTAPQVCVRTHLLSSLCSLPKDHLGRRTTAQRVFIKVRKLCQRIRIRRVPADSTTVLQHLSRFSRKHSSAIYQSKEGYHPSSRI